MRAGFDRPTADGRQVCALWSTKPSWRTVGRLRAIYPCVSQLVLDLSIYVAPESPSLAGGTCKFLPLKSRKLTCPKRAFSSTRAVTSRVDSVA